MSDTSFVDKQTIIEAAWCQDVNDLRYKEPSEGGGAAALPIGGGRTQADKNAEIISVKDFGAVGDGITDDTAAIQAAIDASNGRKLFAPIGKYNYSSLLIPKAVLFHLEGEFDSYNDTEGTVFNCTGSGIGIQIGVDDGNPDGTGPARGTRISGIHFTTLTATTAIRVQNTALVVIENNKFRNFSGKILDLKANVITKIKDNDIAGSTAGTTCYGIWADEQYFGNYVLDILDNHIFQVNCAGRFSEGRSLTVHNNIIENIRPAAGKGVWEFETSGYISKASFQDNYYENHTGYVFGGSTFTGTILNLVVKNEDAWGSADAGNVNPGVGNIPKTRVLAHDIKGNFFVDSAWNSKAYLSLASVYPTTNIFDLSTTVVKSQVTNKDYEDDLAFVFKTSDLLKSSGDFADLTGGVAGALTKTGGTPTGWTNLAAPDWQLIADGISGTFSCFVPGAGDYDRCEKIISLTPVNRQRFFIVAFTAKGWVALRADGNVIFDTGVNVADYFSATALFSIPANASSTVLKFGTNAANPFYLAETRLFEIGSADYNEPGTMNGAVKKAALRNLKRGIY